MAKGRAKLAMAQGVSVWVLRRARRLWRRRRSRAPRHPDHRLPVRTAGADRRQRHRRAHRSSPWRPTPGTGSRRMACWSSSSSSPRAASAARCTQALFARVRSGAGAGRRDRAAAGTAAAYVRPEPRPGRVASRRTSGGRGHGPIRSWAGFRTRACSGSLIMPPPISTSRSPCRAPSQGIHLSPSRLRHLFVEQTGLRVQNLSAVAAAGPGGPPLLGRPVADRSGAWRRLLRLGALQPHLPAHVRPARDHARAIIALAFNRAALPAPIEGVSTPRRRLTMINFIEAKDRCKPTCTCKDCKCGPTCRCDK